MIRAFEPGDAIRLPDDLEMTVVELARTIPEETEHFELCGVALDLANTIRPRMQDILSPIVDRKSFAYLIEAPTYDFTGLDRRVFENAMYIRTIGVASSIGVLSPDPIESYHDVYGGQWVSRVQPQPGHEGEQSFRGSVELDMHIEQQPIPGESVHDTKTGFVVLGTVDNQSQTDSYFTPNQAVVDSLVKHFPATLDTLEKPWYRLRPFDSEKVMGIAPLRPHEPIIREDGSVYYDLADVEPDEDNVLASRAYEIFRNTVNFFRVGHIATPGQILVGDNSQAGHGRGPSGNRLVLSGHVASESLLAARARQAQPTNQ